MIYYFLPSVGFVKLVTGRLPIMRQDIFHAIADATRREILELLTGKPLNINTLTAHFEVSRTAVYKHLKVLEGCGLVVITPQGRERFCEARFSVLTEVTEWANAFLEAKTKPQEPHAEESKDAAKPRKKKHGKKKHKHKASEK